MLEDMRAAACRLVDFLQVFIDRPATKCVCIYDIRHGHALVYHIYATVTLHGLGMDWAWTSHGLAMD
jgi:hypothetical protein